MRPASRWLAIALCAVAGGVLNVYRQVWWQQGGTPQAHGFCAPAELRARELLRFAPGVCRIEIPDALWRPMDVTIQLKTPAPLPATAGVIGTAGRIVHITADDPAMTADAQTVTVGETWQVYTVTVTSPPKPQAPLAIVLRVDQPPIADPRAAYLVAGPDLGRVDARPKVTATSLALPALVGTLLGIVAALLLPPAPGASRRRAREKRENSSLTRADDSAAASPAPSRAERDGLNAAEGSASGARALRAQGAARLRGHEQLDVPTTDRSALRAKRAGAGALGPTRTVVAIFAALVVYFAAWAVARPPYQTPDEVQHHMRTTSVLREPWVAKPGYWTVDPRFTNPLAYWTPGPLAKLFFNPTQRLSRGDVGALKQVEWPDASTQPPPEPYERAIASYPTLYYLTLFAIAEPITRLLALTPYDATYAYRGVSLLLAALCWTLALLQLRRLPATRESATAIGALLVLNPMTAFMASSINVDAVNIPLAVLASLLFWRLLMTGEGEWWTLAALVATSWTKPSGLQLIGALLVATLVIWPFSTIRWKPALLTLARAAIVSWATFYAWSPPRFLGGQPAYDTLTTFVSYRWSTAFTVWVMYWGRLGWLEYTLAPIWYWLLLALVAIGVACAIWRPRGSRAFMLFTATLLIAFVGATLAGEFLYLPLSGHVLQGRHLLPASVGLALLVMHRVRAARMALLAMLVVMNILLIQATIDRYYNGQWKIAAAALPFRR